MKWESKGLHYRLVSSEGEILDEVRITFSGGEYQVLSTGKRYVSEEAAKRAAESRQQSLGPNTAERMP